MPLFGRPNIKKLTRKRDLDGLIKALGDNDPEIRYQAAAGLEELGDERAVAPLTAALRDSEWRVCEAAARALGTLGDERAVAPLIHALEHGDTAVRDAVASALGKLHGGVERLLAALGDPSPHTRGVAAEALGKLSDQRAVAPLIAALKDEDEGVRLEAARALGDVGDAQAVEPLIVALKDDNLGVREWAVLSLQSIGGPDADRALAKHDRRKEARRRRPATKAPQAQAPEAPRRAAAELVDQLAEYSPVLRQEAERALVSLGAGAVDALLQQGRGMRNVRDPAVRWYAARVLGQIGGDRAISALASALMDHDEDVVVEAIEGLGRIGDASAAAVLRTFAESTNDEFLRDRARSAAGQIERRR